MIILMHAMIFVLQLAKNLFLLFCNRTCILCIIFILFILVDFICNSISGTLATQFTYLFQLTCCIVVHVAMCLFLLYSSMYFLIRISFASSISVFLESEENALECCIGIRWIRWIRWIRIRNIRIRRINNINI